MLRICSASLSVCHRRVNLSVLLVESETKNTVAYYIFLASNTVPTVFHSFIYFDAETSDTWCVSGLDGAEDCDNFDRALKFLSTPA